MTAAHGLTVRFPSGVRAAQYVRFMPTTIYFAAPHGDNPLLVRVQEDANVVFSAWTAAQGLPFELTSETGRRRSVWINPATVAYWHETAGSGARL